MQDDRRLSVMSAKMSKKSTKIQNDAQYMAALHAISNIELRAWPEGAPLYEFADSFESDVAMIKAFCKDRRIFGRSTRTLIYRWEELALISKPVFAYYLPAVLLAMIQHPRSPLTRIMLMSPLTYSGYTPAEIEAIDRVNSCLAEHGVTPEAILANIERGRQTLREFGYEVPDASSDDREPTTEP